MLYFSYNTKKTGRKNKNYNKSQKNIYEQKKIFTKSGYFLKNKKIRK